jgi:hypothetical protein
MAQRDWTEMGGVRETFLTTHWSLVDEVKKDGDTFPHVSLNEGRVQMLATNDAVALKIRVNLPLTP